MSDKTLFAPPGSAADLEEGLALTPKFDADGLVTCVATSSADAPATPAGSSSGNASSERDR